MILWFSGTGNSRYAAQVIAKETGDTLVSLNERIKKSDTSPLHSEKPFVLVCPTYAWAVPRVIMAHLNKTVFSGSKEWYFILTCGGGIGNAGGGASVFCRERSLHFAGIMPIVMPENYLAMFPVPDEATSSRIIAAALPKLQEAGRLIAAGEPFPEVKTTPIGQLESGVVNSGFYLTCVKTKKFYATDACVGCGQCVTLCPLNNIRLEKGRPQWGKDCTHCMACICHCPTEAIEYGKKALGKRRYVCTAQVEEEKGD